MALPIMEPDTGFAYTQADLDLLDEMIEVEEVDRFKIALQAYRAFVADDLAYTASIERKSRARKGA